MQEVTYQHSTSCVGVTLVAAFLLPSETFPRPVSMEAFHAAAGDHVVSLKGLSTSRRGLQIVRSRRWG